MDGGALLATMVHRQVVGEAQGSKMGSLLGFQSSKKQYSAMMCVFEVALSLGMGQSRDEDVGVGSWDRCWECAGAVEERNRCEGVRKGWF